MDQTPPTEALTESERTALAAALYRLEWDADLYATPRNHVTEKYERRADRLAAAGYRAAAPVTESRNIGKAHGESITVEVDDAEGDDREARYLSTAFTHDDHSTCLHNAESGTWYRNDDGSRLLNPRPICDREHPNPAPVPTAETRHNHDSIGVYGNCSACETVLPSMTEFETE